MFTSKDVKYKTIYVINCLKDRELRVSNGQLLLEEKEDKKTLTKLPFQKILALFIIGHIHITTPLIDKCKRFNVALVVMKPSLRPVFYWSNSAEANYLLRQRQYQLPKEDINIAKWIVLNKVKNQMSLLQKSRKSDPLTLRAKKICEKAIDVFSKLTNSTRNLLKTCECENGCPSCIYSPKCGNDNKPLHKKATEFILDYMWEEMNKLSPEELSALENQDLEDNISYNETYYNQKEKNNMENEVRYYYPKNEYNAAYGFVRGIVKTPSEYDRSDQGYCETTYVKRFEVSGAIHTCLQEMNKIFKSGHNITPKFKFHLRLVYHILSNL